MSEPVLMSEREKTYLQEMLGKSFWKLIFLRSFPVFICQFVMEFVAFFSYLYNFYAFGMDFAISLMPIQALVQILSSMEVGIVRQYCVKILVPCIEQDTDKAAYEHTLFLMVNFLATTLVILSTLTWAHIFIDIYEIPKSYIPYYVISVLFAYTNTMYFSQINLVFAIERRRLMTLSRGILLVVLQAAIEGSLYLAIDFNSLHNHKSNWPTYVAYLITFAIAIAQSLAAINGKPFFGYINLRELIPRKMARTELVQMLRSKQFWLDVARYELSGLSYLLCSSTSGCVILIAISEVYNLKLQDQEYLQIIFKLFVAYINEFIYESATTATNAIHIECVNILYRSKYYRRAAKFTLECIIISLCFGAIPIVLNMFYPPILTFLPKNDIFDFLITDEINQIAKSKLIVYAARSLYEAVINLALSLKQIYVVILFSILKFAFSLIPVLTTFPENLESTDYVNILIEIEYGQTTMMVILLIGYFCKLYFAFYDDVDRLRQEKKKKKKKQSIERRRAAV